MSSSWRSANAVSWHHQRSWYWHLCCFWQCLTYIISIFDRKTDESQWLASLVPESLHSYHQDFLTCTSQSLKKDCHRKISLFLCLVLKVVILIVALRGKSCINNHLKKLNMEYINTSTDSYKEGYSSVCEYQFGKPWFNTESLYWNPTRNVLLRSVSW